MRPVQRTALLSFFLAVPLAVGALAASSGRNLDAEEANRRLVVEFYERVFNGHDVVKGAEIMADDYKQHNPNVPDGKAPFVQFFTTLFKENPQARSRIVHSATDGDLVWLHVHHTLKPGDRGLAIVDIFRVKDGKLVEHWDVLQDVPEKAVNSNTMF